VVERRALRLWGGAHPDWVVGRNELENERATKTS
jgi:hypothetical protein